MKFDTTKPLAESDEVVMDVPEEEEIEQLNTQLDQLNSVLDNLEQKNDTIKEKLLELLTMVKTNQNQLEVVESCINENGGENTAASTFSQVMNLREQLTQLETCMSSCMMPETNVQELRDQLNELEVGISNLDTNNSPQS